MNMIELLQALNTLEEAKGTCQVCHEDPCSCATEEAITMPDNPDYSKYDKPTFQRNNPKPERKAPQWVGKNTDKPAYQRQADSETNENGMSINVDEAQAGLSDQTAQAINSGKLDIYDILADHVKVQPGEQEFLQAMYDDIAGDHGLHGDDDFEEIIDRMHDYIQADYSDESAGAQGDIGGAHGDETISPIHGGQKEEPTMENLDVASLKYLAGVNKTIAECGMGNASSPASINITAGSGGELTGMLKDLMGLAGVHKVEPQHMPIDNPEQGPSKVISAPPNMQDLIAMVDKPENAIHVPVPRGDSMNDSDKVEDEGMEKNRPYDNSPDEEVKGDGVRQYGDVDNNFQNALVGKNRGTAESIVASLFQDYQNFVTEENKK